MVQLNLALREINCKVVFFGCGLSGKTTNLEIIHEKAAKESRGELTSIATESDRTLFFDFMPLDLGTVSGMRVKFQLYTVPGQVYYNSTRKLVLRGADGVVFVVDSQASKMSENVESLENLEECLREQGRSLEEMPHVIQFNKRDLPEALTVDELKAKLVKHGCQTFEAVASRGDGVLECFKSLAGQLLERVKNMSTESASKPTVQTQRMAVMPAASLADRARPLSDRMKLQGGLAGGTATPSATPVRVEQRVIDRRTPLTPAAAMHRSTAIATPVAQPAVSVQSSARAARAAAVPVAQGRIAHAVQVQKGDSRRHQTGQLTISSRRRRRGVGQLLLWIGFSLVAVGALAAAYWHFIW